jgi:hypothetical protein
VCWGVDEFQAHRSRASAWPGKGCSNGVDPSFFLYGPDLDSWMVAGPFDLTGATAAELRFFLWHQMLGQVAGGQASGDSLFWGASIDGSSFFGQSVSGSSTNVEPPTPTGWTEVAFDLAHVPTLGDLSGRSQVWLGWRFVSDGSGLDDGPFVDDILLRAQAAVIPDTPGAFGRGNR